MRKRGNESAGYEINVDRAKRVLNLRAWGFWDMALAQSFGQEMRASFAELAGSAWDILTDGSNYPAQKTEITEVIGGLMAVAPAAGMRRAANVVNGALDKMQLARIASENKLPNIKFFRSVAEAREWLATA